MHVRLSMEADFIAVAPPEATRGIHIKGEFQSFSSLKASASVLTVLPSHFFYPIFTKMAANNVELPETMKVRTLDDQLMNVPGKLIKESEVLMKALESNDGSSIDESIVPAQAEDLANAIKTLDLCDLSTPYVPTTSKTERTAFADANERAMEFFKSLPDMTMFQISYAADALKIPRLIDLCLVFFLEVAQGKDTKQLREVFGLRDDYTPEEENEIRKAHETTA